MSWPKMLLGEVATLQRGFDLPIQNRLKGSAPIFAANGPVGFHSETRVVGPGVVTGRSGSIGKVHYVESGYWPLNTALYVKDFHGNDPKYVYWLLRHLRLERFHHGTGVPTLNRNVVHRELVSVPPLPDQRRIAAILDKADALRAKRREAIAKLDQLLQSVFAMDTASHRKRGASTIDELLSTKVLLQHKDGNHGSQYPRKEEFGEQGVPFLSARNLSEEGTIDLEDIQRLTESKASSLRIGWIQAGDVLLAHNASVGKVALYRGEFDRALIGTSLTAFRPNIEKLRPEFLYMSLRSNQFQRELTKDMSQTTRNQVPITAQRRLSIFVPTIDVQDRIVRAVDAIELQKDALLLQSAEIEHLFVAIQHDAFAGTL